MIIAKLEEEIFGERCDDPFARQRSIKKFACYFDDLKNLEHQIYTLDDKLHCARSIHPKIYSGYCEREIELDEDCLDKAALEHILEKLKRKYKLIYTTILIRMSEYARDNKEFLDELLDSYEKGREEETRKFFDRLEQTGNKQNQ